MNHLLGARELGFFQVKNEKCLLLGEKREGSISTAVWWLSDFTNSVSNFNFFLRKSQLIHRTNLFLNCQDK